VRQGFEGGISVKAKLLGTLVIVAGASLIGVAGVRAQGYPIMEKVAQRVIEKYQSSSCQQLASKRGQPPPPAEQRVVQLMRDDPAMRAAFIDRVAAPIANKLFECHLVGIPITDLGSDVLWSRDLNVAID
jgi:hypothetical protein